MLCEARSWLKCWAVVIWGFCCCSVTHNREQTFSLIIISRWADGFLLPSSLWLVMHSGEVWWIWPSEKSFRRGRNRRNPTISEIYPLSLPCDSESSISLRFAPSSTYCSTASLDTLPGKLLVMHRAGSNFGPSFHPQAGREILMSLSLQLAPRRASAERRLPRAGENSPL